MENVFRLTHGRDMTTDERRLFGLSCGDDGDKMDRRSSHNHHDRDGA